MAAPSELGPHCRLPSPSSRSKKDPGCWGCQARVRILPVEEPVLNLGALSQPGGSVVVVCICTVCGEGLLRPLLPGSVGLCWLRWLH